MTDDSKKKIEEFVKHGILDNEIYLTLWKTHTREAILKTFRNRMKLTPIEVPRIWMSIISKWDKDNILGKESLIVLRKVLDEHGVSTSLATRNHLSKYGNTKAINELEEKNIIVCFELSSKEKILVLHWATRIKDIKLEEF